MPGAVARGEEFCVTILFESRSIPALRDTEFPIAAEWASLNHAYQSPNPLRAIAAIQDRVTFAQRPYLHFPEHEQALDEIKRHLSGMTGFAPSQFALLTNVGDATTTLASGLDLNPGDEIILLESEFPTFVFPWRIQEHRSARCIFVPKNGITVDLNRVEAAITDHTRVVVVSHVDFLSGYKNDIASLGRLCRERGIYLFLDTSQALGVLHTDYAALGVAGIVSVGFKWLMGLHGLSVLGIADWAIDAITPTIPGRNGMTDDWMDGDLGLNFLPDARKYQNGNLNWMAVWGMAASLSLHEEVGYANVESLAMAMRQRLVDGLKQRDVEITSDLDPAHASTIVTFAMGSPRETESFVAAAAGQNISLTFRNGWVRSAVHFWNDASDIDRLLAFIDAYRLD